MAEMRRSSLVLPREHGFWVMLLAALATAVGHHARLPLAWLLALLLLFLGTAVAGLLGRYVRRAEAAQVGSAKALAFAGVPIELAAGAPTRVWLTRACVWAVIFVAGALLVRAAFARAARRTHRARVLDFSSVMLCLLSTTLFIAFGFRAEGFATALAALVSAGIVWLHPTVKQLKPVGLALAGLSVTTAVILLA
jgi:hypothetical protein